MAKKSAPYSSAFYVKKANKKGQGVFSAHEIKKGVLVTYLSGFVLPTNALKDSYLALQIDNDMWLCSKGGNMDDFINHSCDPNTAFLDGGLKLYALRKIRKDEEITFDYSTAMTDKDWYLHCKCGSKHCRGKVLPFQKHPKRFRKDKIHESLDYIRKTYG
jgi:SET domain-containing protein